MKRRLSDLTSAASVQAALDEFVQLGQSEFLKRYGFRAARSYRILDPRTGIEADSKAIAAVALMHQFGDSEALKPKDFSGGDATVAARLQLLGFVVHHEPARPVREDWSVGEVELIVIDYLAMLTMELTGQRYNKAAHRRALLGQLPHRSNGAIEFKHCNISAVMLEMGFPYLRGYQPRINFQRQLLAGTVANQIQRHQLLDRAAMAAIERPVQAPKHADFSVVRSDAPIRQIAAEEPGAVYARAPIRRDYMEREAHNRSLGLAGEEFALGYERWRLAQLGAEQLADKVVHASLKEGDGLGYDIRSFEPNGLDRYIEVKTTTFGARTPFFVSANEVRFAREKTERFRIYRLFDFRESPRLFELPGPIEGHCTLDPTTFRASFG